MAISSPLQSKVPTGSVKTIKKFQTILLNRTKVRREIFQQQTILQNRRIENERRKQREDELEAPNLVTKPRGAAGLIAGSAKGFFERLVGFLSYLTAGWIINNLPTWISMGKEFIARTQQMGKILGGFITNSTNIFKNFTKLLGAGLTNLMKFDFLDTSGRVSTAFDELNLSVENWGAGFEDVIKLITTPLTEGIASGEDARPLGTENTNEGAYERTAPYSGTPAPQVMLEGGISGTTALLPSGAKGADRYIGATDRFGYSSSRGRQHNGIDIGTTGNKGYYVAFLLDGTATLIPNLGNAGNVVEIKSGGITYKFFHLARFSIKSGPYKAGTAIGEIGNSGTKGRAIDIHLHYEVWPPGTRGVNPEPYVNLIKIGKNLGKPIAAPSSVSSSSTSQPQQNLMGTSSSSSLSSGGTKPGAYDIISKIGVNKSQWDIYRNTLAEIESGGRYNVPGGSGKHYDGRYQMGELAKKDAARILGIPYPGHSDNPNDPKRVSFRNNPELQEKMFAAYTLANHGYLSSNSKYQSKKTIEQKLQVLGYAHNQGAGGAAKWLNTGIVGIDGFNTKGTRYSDALAKNLKGSVNPYPNQTVPSTQSTPSPAQITPTGTSQNPQISQSLAPERTGPTVIVSQNPSSPTRQMMYSGGGGSSGGGSSQISDFALLNNFIKNKLLLDLAYL
jgi:hypothetical protein